MNLTVFGPLVAYGVDSGAAMTTSVFMTIRVLGPKRSGLKMVILSGAYCIKKTIEKIISKCDK